MFGGIFALAGSVAALWLVRESDIQRSEEYGDLVAEPVAA